MKLAPVMLIADTCSPSSQHFCRKRARSWKFIAKLSAKTFQNSNRLESPRKSSTLRPVIQRLISEACARRRKLALQRELGVPWFSRDPDNLLALPEFGNSPEAIDRWVRDLLYPQLKAMESELAADPKIAKIKKAWGQGGTFRVSRLKVQIKETVERIARNPPPLLLPCRLTLSSCLGSPSGVFR